MKDIVTRLRESDGGYFMRQIFTEAADTIERLTAERDLARREVCRSRAYCIQGKTPEEIANALGWCCFKEDAT